MADRIIPPSSGDSGERRPPASRPTGGYSERPPQPRGTGDYNERPSQPRGGSGYEDLSHSTRIASGGYGTQSQSSRSAGSYGERPPASRGAGSYGERRSAPSRSAGGSRQSTPRRIDVIRCENCGEDYSVTYKRCPFCDERPGRGGVSGRRVSNTRGGGYGRPVNPIQIAGLVISLALIASALFIVFRFIGAPIFANRKPNPSQSGSQNSSQSSVTPGGSSSAGKDPVTAPPMVQSLTLNNAGAPLDHGGTYQLTANLLPVGATGEVSWSSSDVTVATVDASGLVTNLNSGSSDVMVTITATCGDVSAQTSITCKAKAASGTVSSGTRGKIVNAEKGLNIRSGPGTTYDVVASAKNGTTITILGEENNFYKINYSGDKIGYVSKDYVSVG